MEGRLERLLANVARVVAGGLVAVLVLTYAAFMSPTLRAHLGLDALHSPSPYQRGQYVDVPDVLYKDARLTVIVFARSSCPGCQAAKPFLTRLAHVTKTSGDYRMVLLTPTPIVDQERQFAADIGIASDALVSAARLSLRVRAVPTIVVSDSRGRVVYALEGIPNEEQQSAVLRLFSVSGTTG